MKVVLSWHVHYIWYLEHFSLHIGQKRWKKSGIKNDEKHQFLANIIKVDGTQKKESSRLSNLDVNDDVVTNNM